METPKWPIFHIRTFMSPSMGASNILFATLQKSSGRCTVRCHFQWVFYKISNAVSLDSETKFSSRNSWPSAKEKQLAAQSCIKIPWTDFTVEILNDDCSSSKLGEVSSNPSLTRGHWNRWAHKVFWKHYPEWNWNSFWNHDNSSKLSMPVLWAWLIGRCIFCWGEQWSNMSISPKSVMLTADRPWHCTQRKVTK